MFGKRVIRLGDPTTHGGVVVSAASNYVMYDKPVACLGDHVTCPLPGHGTCVIVEGDPTWTIDGRHVALEGHKTSCGASLISTLPNVTRSYEGMGSASSGVDMPGVSLGAVDAFSEVAVAPQLRERFDFDEQAHLNAVGYAALAGLPYYIETTDGRAFGGRADQGGLLPRVDTPGEEEFAVYWGDEALVRMEEAD